MRTSPSTSSVSHRSDSAFFLHRCRFRPGTWVANTLVVVLTGATVSLTIEILQAWLPNPTSSMTDLLTNTDGTLRGVVLALVVRTWARLKKTAARGPVNPTSHLSVDSPALADHAVGRQCLINPFRLCPTSAIPVLISVPSGARRRMAPVVSSEPAAKAVTAVKRKGMNYECSA